MKQLNQIEPSEISNQNQECTAVQNQECTAEQEVVEIKIKENHQKSESRMYSRTGRLQEMRNS